LILNTDEFSDWQQKTGNDAMEKAAIESAAYQKRTYCVARTALVVAMVALAVSIAPFLVRWCSRPVYDAPATVDTAVTAPAAIQKAMPSPRD
jgi:hypothetical protein